MQLCIEPARPELLDQLERLERAAFPTAWSRAELAGQIDDPRALFLAARPADGPGDNALIGYVLCWRVLDELHLLKIAVRPDQRRQGVAQRLMHELIERGQANGAIEVQLEVRAGNRPGIGLYEALGFVKVGLRPRYYGDTGEDALLYTLTLGERR